MSDVEEADVADSIRDACQERAKRGVTVVTLNIRDVLTLLNRYRNLRNDYQAAQRTIEFMSTTALLPEAYELGRQAGVAEAEAASGKRLEEAARQVSGMVDDLAAGERG